MLKYQIGKSSSKVSTFSKFSLLSKIALKLCVRYLYLYFVNTFRYSESVNKYL